MLQSQGLVVLGRHQKLPDTSQEWSVVQRYLTIALTDEEIIEDGDNIDHDQYLILAEQRLQHTDTTLTILIDSIASAIIKQDLDLDPAISLQVGLDGRDQLLLLGSGAQVQGRQGDSLLGRTS